MLEDRRSLSLRETVRRHVALIVVMTIAITALGALYSLHKAKQYSATASVLVRALPGNALSAASLASNQQIDVAMETEAGLVSSPEVTALAAKSLHVSPDALTSHVSASIPSNTEIVLVKYTAGTPVAARDGAEAFANAFLAYRTKQAVDNQQIQLTELQRQAALASAELNAATAAAAAVHPVAGAATRVQLAANRLGSLQTSIGTLQIIDHNSGTVVAPAVLGKPLGLSPKIVVIAAFLVGLGLAVCVAVWRERRDDHFRASAEATVAGIPVLTSLPDADGELDDAAIDNAYRRARTGLVAATRSPNTIVVSATTGVRDRGEVAANLALSLSRAGYDVTLIDAGIDGSDLPAMLGATAGKGLSDLLSSAGDVTSLLQERHGIHFLHMGTDPGSARERFASPRLKDILGALRRSNDYVIVSAPGAGTPEAESLAWAADGLVLVIGDEVTTHGELGELIDETDRLGISVIGAISTPHVRTPQRGRRSRRSATTSARPAERQELNAVTPPADTNVESA